MINLYTAFACCECLVSGCESDQRIGCSGKSFLVAIFFIRAGLNELRARNEHDCYALMIPNPIPLRIQKYKVYLFFYLVFILTTVIYAIPLSI